MARSQWVGFRIASEIDVLFHVYVTDPQREVKSEVLTGATPTLARPAELESLRIWEVVAGPGAPGSANISELLIPGVDYTVNFGTDQVTFLAPHPKAASDYLADYTKPCRPVPGIAAASMELYVVPDILFGGPTATNVPLSVFNWIENDATNVPGLYTAVISGGTLDTILDFFGQNVGSYSLQFRVTSAPAGFDPDRLMIQTVVHNPRRFETG